MAKQNDNIFNILGCLPDRSYTSSMAGRRKSLEDVHSSIDNLEFHFNAIQILEKYGIYITVKSIKMLEEFSRAKDVSIQSQHGEGDSNMSTGSFMSVLNESMEDRNEEGGGDRDEVNEESEDGVGGLFTKMCRLASRV